MLRLGADLAMCASGLPSQHLTFFIRENDGSGAQPRFIGRVDGCGFGSNGNAFVVEDKGWRGACRIDHGPRVVIAPVIAASMAA